LHRRLSGIAAGAAPLLALLALAAATALATPGDIDRVTLSTTGGNPDDASGNPATSLDGSIVVFQSDATNLDEFHSDTNNRLDVFIRQDASTVRASFANGGGFTESDDNSADPDLTDDGSQVAFDSFSDVLVPGDSGGFRDVFLRTPESAATTRVSVANGGGNPNGDSSNPDLFSDNSRVVFQSSATNLLPAPTTGTQIFEVDTGPTTLLVSTKEIGVGPQADGDSRNPVIADDDDAVAYESDATNLVAGDTNGDSDIYFIRTVSHGLPERISVTSDEDQAEGDSVTPAISSDGNLVAFVSNAALAPGGTAGSKGAFLRNRTEGGSTERVDLTYDGSLSDGTHSPGTALGTTDPPSISADGRYVAFSSDEDSLVPNDSNGTQDVFVRDRQENRTIRLSVRPSGAEATRRSAAPSISDDGNRVVFASEDNGLVPGDTTDPNISDFWEIFAAEPDWSPPSTSFASGPPATAFPGRVAMTFGSSEGGSSFQCRVDGGSFARCPASYVTPPLTAGSHTVQVRAVDRFGNFDASPAQATVQVQPAQAPPAGTPTAPEPVFENSFVAEPVSGTVLIRLPGTSTFVPIESVTSFPEGSTIDARNGRVRITSAKSSTGGEQSSVFYGGIFTVTYEPGQAFESRKKKRKRPRPVTQLKLRGTLGPCPKVKRKKARGAHESRKRRRRRRRLWGHGRGRFRTRGRHASATVRGTWWLTEDRCDGTLTYVRRGKVRVRDFRRRKTVTVKARHRYLARATRRR